MCKLRKIGIILTLAIALINVSSVYAATQTYSTEVENNISTGDIDISLNEYELDDSGNRVPYTDNKKVVPGDVVDKIVVITNNAEQAWIRAKVEYNTDDGIENMSDDMLDGISDTWKKCGDYFYYTKPVDKEKSIDLFTKVKIPTEWTEKYENKGFSIGITAQAIQSVHFTPNFNSDEPWFGVPIEKCIHTNHDIYRVDSKDGFSVVFENGSEGFIRLGDDFFKNFNALMPGDIVTESVIYGNNVGRKISISFATDIPEQDEDSLKLLKDLKLIIKNNDVEIYNGDLGAESLKGGIVIGSEINKGYRGTLNYTIEMPKELQNASAMQKAKVKWIFRTEYNPKPDTPPNGNSGGGGGGGSDRTPDPNPTPINDNNTPRNEIHDPTTSDNKTIEDNKTPLIDKLKELIIPDTGDRTNLQIFVIVAICASMSIGFLVVEGKKSKKDKKRDIT